MKTCLGLGLVLACFTASLIHIVSNTFRYDLPPDLSSDYLEEDDKAIIKVGDSPTNISWFVHLTDLHLSKFYAPDRTSGFHQLVEDLLRSVKPCAVVVTGDLTDAKTIDYSGSRQFKEEWIDYKVGVELATNRTVWLDIRGNHDNFDVSGLNHRNNFFKDFSSQGPKGNLASYLKIVNNNGVRLGFLALDATLKPAGPKRPFNFVGALNKAEMDQLHALARQSTEEADMTIWFGHYPTSMIVSPDPGHRELMAEGLVYLCGHLHSLHGLANTMVVRHRTGLREAELTDWKDERELRLMAVDHGVLSWKDIKAVSGLSLPIVLVTWPPGGLRAGDREPLYLIPSSTHIRLLVFSNTNQITVKVAVDRDVLKEAYSKDGQVYTIPWQPKLYSSGYHTIYVEVEERGETVLVESHQFSLEDTSANLPLLGQVILLTDIIAVFQFCFILLVCLAILPLTLLRLYPAPLYTPYCFIAIAHLNQFYWSLVLAPLYLAFGPWFVGEVLSGSIGAVFVWGSIVYGTYIPTATTWLYGTYHLAGIHLPIMLATSLSLQSRLLEVTTSPVHPVIKPLLCHGPMIVLTFIQVYLVHSFHLSYGIWAVILGPFRTGYLFLTLFLWLQSSQLNIKASTAFLTSKYSRVQIC